MSKKKEKVEEPAFLKSLLNNPVPNYRVYVPGKIEKALVSVVCFILGAFVGWVFYGSLFKIEGNPTMMTYIADAIVFVIVGFFATKFLMPMYLKRCLEKQRNKLKKQFRDLLEALTASISSGSNASQAFEAAYNDLANQYSPDDFIMIEVNEINVGVRQNFDLGELVMNFGDRSDNEDIANFAIVFKVCLEKGGNLNTVIHQTNAVISDKMAIADEIETKLTSNKMQHNIMSLMPIPIVAMLKFSNDSFAANFASFKGIAVNTVAIVIFVLAYKYGLKIVDIKE